MRFLTHKPSICCCPALISQMLQMRPVGVHEAEPTQPFDMLFGNQAVQVQTLQLTPETGMLHVSLPTELGHYCKSLQIPLQ